MQHWTVSKVFYHLWCDAKHLDAGVFDGSDLGGKWHPNTTSSLETINSIDEVVLGITKGVRALIFLTPDVYFNESINVAGDEVQELILTWISTDCMNKHGYS